MANKRYYWLKLKEDFFSEKYVKALRRLPQGDSLVIVYLKMQLKSLKTEGVINYEGILPNCIAELAMTIDEDENVVRLAVEALINFGAIEQWENDTLYMAAMQELIGSETAVAERVRKHRALQCNTKTLLSNSGVTKCNTDIDIEKRDRDRDRDRDREKIKAPSDKIEQEQENVFLKIPLNDGTEYPISEDLIERYQSLYPIVDIRQEIRNYCGWAIANPTKRKTKRGILTSINIWLAKKQDSNNYNTNWNKKEQKGHATVGKYVKSDGSEYAEFD